MKILSVQHRVPAKKLTNEEALDRVAAASCEHLTRSEIDTVQAYLKDLFAATGLRSRYITDGKEKPIDLVTEAAEKALAAAGVAAKDLDFIIFGGVGRGFLVPSYASAVQYALGVTGVNCFDVLDACASWARGMQVAQSYLKSGLGEVGLVVNSETGFYEDYGLWNVRAADDIKIEGGQFTIGEAATATVVAKADAEFEIGSATFGQFGDLAILQIIDSDRYMRHARQPSGILRFYTRSNELTMAGLRLGVDLMRDYSPIKGRKIDAFVPHAGAAPSVPIFMRAVELKVPEVVMTFPDYGNTVSASIPLGLSFATADGRIKRGDRVFAATIAAGITVITLVFTY